jgi:hypothetical protein
MSYRAKFVREIKVIGSDNKSEVTLEVYEHENGGTFAIDSSYLDQVLNRHDSMELAIPDPFSTFMHEEK